MGTSNTQQLKVTEYNWTHIVLSQHYAGADDWHWQNEMVGGMMCVQLVINSCNQSVLQ